MEAVAINGRGISGGDSDGAVKSMTLRLPRRVSIPLCARSGILEALDIVDVVGRSCRKLSEMIDGVRSRELMIDGGILCLDVPFVRVYRSVVDFR
jgi:hypothetical protein